MSINPNMLSINPGPPAISTLAVTGPFVRQPASSFAGSCFGNSLRQGGTIMSEQLQGDSLEASLTVADLEHSATWYADVLGFSEDRRHQREGKLIAVSLQAGSVRILLTQDDGTKGLDRAKGVGLSLQITTHQSADALADQIKRQGGNLDSEPMTMPHGARVFRLHDPDGFRLTISSTHAA